MSECSKNLEIRFSFVCIISTKLCHFENLCHKYSMLGFHLRSGPLKRKGYDDHAENILCNSGKMSKNKSNFLEMYYHLHLQ